MKRFSRFELLAALILLLLPCACAQQQTLTILHTNDMHASFLPHQAYWVNQTPKPMVGGFAELFFVSDSIRRSGGEVLMLDAGDVMTGNPITERRYGGARGGSLFEMMNMIGYDAWSPGNHDFDVSQENLKALTEIAAFPTLCANLVNDAGAYPVNNRPYVLFQRGGLKIAVIGVISQYLYNLVIQKNLTGLRVQSPSETLQKWVTELRPKADLIIALTHQGADEDSVLGAEVKGLDIIVGGHSHTRLREAKVVDGVLIVQAGSNAENLGILTVRVDKGRVVRHEGGLLPLWARSGRPHNRLTALIDSMKSEIDKEYDEVIGTLKVNWIRRDSAMGIGTFVTEAQREAVHADVAFMNIDGMRKDLTPGPITKKDLFEVLPFQNTLTTFQLSGSQIRSALEHSLRERPRILITGVAADWKPAPDGGVMLLNVSIGGKPLDGDRMYICTASDYFVGEAVRYLGFDLPQRIYLEQTLFQSVERAIREAGVISSNKPYLIRRVSR